VTRAQHIKVLMSEHGITHSTRPFLRRDSWDKTHPFFGRIDSRNPARLSGQALCTKVYLPQRDFGRSQWAYFTALHEIGHIVIGHFAERFRYWDDRLNNEADAWLWALDNAIEPPTPKTRKRIWHLGLGSYTPWDDAKDGPSFQKMLSRLGRKYCVERLGWAA
jgi:hypothetical protein